MESRIEYMDLDTQVRYYQNQIDKSNNPKTKRPSPHKNMDHKPLLPRPPKSSSELGMMKRGGRYTPGRLRIPANAIK